MQRLNIIIEYNLHSPYQPRAHMAAASVPAFDNKFVSHF